MSGQAIPGRGGCSKWHLLILLSWVMLLWGVQYARRGYWEPDEARFVYVAREMAASGEWLVPHRHGVTYADKPPLMFWLINLGETVFPKPFGSHLPTLIGVLLALWAVHGIGTLWRDQATGLRAVLVLSSAWQFWESAGNGQIDGLLLGLEMAALYLLFRNGRERCRQTPWLAFILMGLAVLAKGPVGLLVPLGVYLAVSFCSKDEARLNWGRLGLGVLVSLALPGAWILACWLSGAPAEYLRELLFTQNVSRAAGALGHRKPIFYFLLHTPLGFMPWTLLLPAAYLKLRKCDPALLRKLTGWVLFVIVFFSIPSSKRNLYILLALPGLALGVAAVWDELEKMRSCRAIALSVLSLVVFFLAGCSLAVLLKTSIMPALNVSEFATSLFASLSPWPFLVTFAVAALGLGRMLSNRTRWLTGYAVALCLTCAAVGALIFPAFNTLKVPDEIRTLAQQYIPQNGRLLLYGIFGESLALHSGRMGMRCNTDEALAAAMQAQGRGLAVFPKRDTQDMQQRFPLITATGSFRMGSKTYVWAAFDPPPHPR